MLLLSPAWQARLRASRQLRNLLLQTFVIHPALLFFLLFVLMSYGSGSSGQMLLREAERLVRNAPAGQVWDCQSSARKGEVAPQDLSIPPQSVKTDRAWPTPAPAVAPCVNVAVSRDEWVTDANRMLLSFYKAGVFLSVAACVTVRVLRQLTLRGRP